MASAEGAARRSAGGQGVAWRTTLFDVARALSILVLSLAVALKFEHVLASVYGPPLDVAAELAVILLELVMVGWFATGARPRTLRWVGAFFWGALAILSGIYVWEGRPTCGCFGEVTVRPVLVLLLGASLCAAFVASYTHGARRAAGARRLAIWLGLGSVVAAMALAIDSEAKRQWRKHHAIERMSVGLDSVLYGVSWESCMVSRGITSW